MTFRVEIHDLKNFTPKQRDACTVACTMLENELRSPYFWSEVAQAWDGFTHKWIMLNGIKTALTFDSYRAYVLSGKDKFNTASDGDLDLHLTMYYSFRNVVGYTYPSTWFTWINRKFFAKFKSGDIAGNIFHEYMHNMGMDHPNVDKKSVVYQVGYIVRDRINEKQVISVNPTRRIFKPSVFTRVKRFFSRWF